MQVSTAGIPRISLIEAHTETTHTQMDIQYQFTVPHSQFQEKMAKGAVAKQITQMVMPREVDKMKCPTLLFPPHLPRQ